VAKHHPQPPGDEPALSFHDLAERTTEQIRVYLSEDLFAELNEMMLISDEDHVLLIALGEDLDDTRRVPAELRAELASYRAVIDGLPKMIAQAITCGP
jgi:hypothetical protein